MHEVIALADFLRYELTHVLASQFLHYGEDRVALRVGFHDRCKQLFVLRLLNYFDKFVDPNGY